MPSFVRDKNNIPAAILALDEATEEYLDKLGKATLEEIDKGFDTGEDPLGQAWAPLDPDTVRRKGHAQILEETGDYRDSFEYTVDEDSMAVAIGSNSQLSRFHEFGTEDLPRRPVLQPAATWANEKLIVPMGKEVIGDALDGVTF